MARRTRKRTSASTTGTAGAGRTRGTATGTADVAEKDELTTADDAASDTSGTDDADEPDASDTSADVEDATTDDDGSTDDARAEDDDAFDGFDDEITPQRRRRRTADPVRTAKRRPERATTPEGAKDSAASSTARARKSAEAERSRSTRRRVASVAPNPEWLAPTAVTLLLLGLVYLVTFYLSSGQLPLPIENWNLLVGFAIMIAGGGLLMRWK